MRFLFCLDLNLHAGVGNFFWNFDFLTEHGLRKEAGHGGLAIACRVVARRGAGKENREPSRPARGGRRRSLLGLACVICFLVDGMKWPPIKSMAWRTARAASACLHSFANRFAVLSLK